MSRPAVDCKVFLALCFIFTLGFCLRLALAPRTAHMDTVAVRSWMESSVKLGLGRSYRQQVSTQWLPNYPPLATAMLEASGYAYKWLISPNYTISEPAQTVFAKLPAILADLVTCFLLFFIMKRLRSTGAGLTAAAIYMLHPAVLFDSTIWGQTDALYVVFMMGAVAAFISKKPILGAVLAFVSCLVKVQALVLFPVFLVLLPWDRKKLVRTLLICEVILLFVIIPFIMAGTLLQMMHTYVPHDVLRESHATWGAYNLWLIALWPHGFSTPGTDVILGSLTYDRLSMLAFVLLAAIIIRRFWSRLRGDLSQPQNAYALLYVLSFLSLLVFTIGTEMHERYLFPFVAFGLPLAFKNRRYAFFYVLVSLLFVLNMTASFPYSALDQTILHWSPRVPLWIAAAQCIVLLLFGMDTIESAAQPR